MRTRSLLLPAVAVLATGIALAPAQAAPAGMAGPVERNPTARTVDLGTLGGTSSEAYAVDGSVIVGYAKTASGHIHAFAYDLAADKPAMQDLGTLGGKFSGATAVDGSIVLGVSTTASGEYHAFFYDIAAANPVMHDLVPLGGRNSAAADVDGDIVVGNSSTVSTSESASGDPHAFAYDLGAAEPVMRDLGTLGGTYSAAKAVYGSIVVGDSATASGHIHVFAYDLAAADPTMIDLGTLGGDTSGATDLDGSVVVGTSLTASGTIHPFAYDLSAPTPAMRDLGTLGGRIGSYPYPAVDGATVVGTSVITAPRRLRAFAYDLAAPDPAMKDLGTVVGGASTYVTATEIDGDVVVGNWRALQRKDQPSAFAYDLGADEPTMLDLGSWRGRGATAADVSGDVVVGRVVRGAHDRATAWVLRQTTRPLIAFTSFDHSVEETDGRVTIRVTRYGRTDRAVTVHYRTRGASAKAGKDFAATSGTLRFARGVTHRSFTLRILNDQQREGQQSLLLGLSHPSGRALLGTPRWAQVLIRPSDL